jgi:hypothetical protein
MSTPRRDFIGWLGATALAGSAPAMLVGAPAPIRRLEAAGLPSSNDWDMGWVGRLRGSQKLLFDAPDLAEGDPILRAHLIARQYAEVLGVPVAAQSRVLVFRHLGIHFAMNDAYWARFDIGSETGFLDANGDGVRVNPIRAARNEVPGPFRPLTLEAYQRSGGEVLACHLALQHYVAPRYAATGMSDEAALEAASADVLPGIVMQPSGVFAVAVAQQAGCAYVPVS